MVHRLGRPLPPPTIYSNKGPSSVEKLSFYGIKPKLKAGSFLYSPVRHDQLVIGLACVTPLDTVHPEPRPSSYLFVHP